MTLLSLEQTEHYSVFQLSFCYAKKQIVVVQRTWKALK